VVAADRRWLSSSYEKAYDQFSGAVEESGRPLGYLFLDKTFQLVAAVPQLEATALRDYWDRLLLGGKPVEPGAGFDRVLSEAEEQFKDAETDGELLQLLERFTGADPMLRQPLRVAAMRRLSTPKMQERTQHSLARFEPLIEPNPRAMKRVVNAYGVHRDTAILTGAVGEQNGLELDPLALWTILAIRWPLLAECLEIEPATVAAIGAGEPPADIPSKVQPLFRDPEVQRVVGGDGISRALDEGVIRACVRMAAAASRPPIEAAT
jgi:hypothetical protein